MHTVYSDEHHYQDGNVELFEGKVVKPHEIPRRAEIVLERVKSERLGEVVAPRDFGLDPIFAVHDRGFVTFLQECWSDWVKSGRSFDALPHVWPVPGLLPRGKQRQVPDSIEASLSAITDLGARLGVDDFGTGYASLPTLQRLRASSVCIDRKLLAGVPQDAERAGLARALIALARGMNFEVVAKGVESPAQREFLAESGCRICQGSLFSGAEAPSVVAPILRARLAA